MSPVEFFTAFLAGLASFFSPCVFPLIPGYISLISGISAKDLIEDVSPGPVSRKAGLGSLAFVAGFSIAFSMLGATASAFGRILSGHREALAKVSGLILIFLGLHLTGVFSLRWFNYEKRFSLSRFKPGAAGAFLMGIAFAAGWSPCVGPVLAGILAMAASSGTAWSGVLLLFTYSMGLGLPFLAAGFATGRFLGWIAKYKRFLRYSETAAGIILIIVGLYVFRDRLMSLQRLFYSGEG